MIRSHVLSCSYVPTSLKQMLLTMVAIFDANNKIVCIEGTNHRGEIRYSLISGARKEDEPIEMAAARLVSNRCQVEIPQNLFKCEDKFIFYVTDTATHQEFTSIVDPVVAHVTFIPFDQVGIKCLSYDEFAKYIDEQQHVSTGESYMFLHVYRYLLRLWPK